MSNRTYVCLNCKKSYRREQNQGVMTCPICGETCEYVDWKIRIPSPKRVKQWNEFWEKYRAEKRLLERFHSDSEPELDEVKLEIMNLHLTKKRR